MTELKNDKTVVIDLRTREEGVAVEETAMQNAGIEYHNLPIGKSGISAETRSSFATLLDTHAGEPVLVHCRSGNRAGWLWATYLMDTGATSDEALAAVSGIVTNEALVTAIKAYEPE